MKLPSKGKNRKAEIQEFADEMKKLTHRVGMKISARGWCYIMEGFNLITKAQFDVVEKLINDGCRRKGMLPIDFVAQEEARRFSGVEHPDTESPAMYMQSCLNMALNAGNYYTPDWWEGEQYYVQMLVEKIDLKTLFKPVCQKFHIPIATGSGWQSMLQRAEYGRRFKKAKAIGLKCVLLYCGDHDPDGSRISDKLRKNLEDLSNINWADDTAGYNPELLDIKRFGLNYDFIIANKLTWIDNLITARRNRDGSVRDLADPSHPNHYLPYVQDYLKKYGPRKCEANSLIIKPDESRTLCRQAIEEYLGNDAEARFREKRERVKQTFEEFKDRTGLNESIQKAISLIEEEEKD
ncbi:hypothetical protein ES703_74349 [subsurface metagenome]